MSQCTCASGSCSYTGQAEIEDDRAIKAYHDRAAVAMRDIANVLKGDKGAEIWGQLSIEEQGELWSVLGRTRGKEAWTNVEMQEALSGQFTGHYDLYFVLYRNPCPAATSSAARLISRHTHGPTGADQLAHITTHPPSPFCAPPISFRRQPRSLPSDRR